MDDLAAGRNDRDKTREMIAQLVVVGEMGSARSEK
jgi:hypothetical protein